MSKNNKKNNSNEKQNIMKSKELKIIIVGDSGTGKTSFVNRYILNKFVDTCLATIVSQFSYKILKIGDLTYRLNFWDIAGQDRNPEATKIFCKNTNGIILCCDASYRKSRDNTIKWKESVDKNINLKNIPIIIIENKCDLLGETENDYNKDIDELKNFAEQNNIKNSFRTSAMKGYGIEDSMNYLINEIINMNNLNDAYEEEENLRETIALSEKPHHNSRAKKGNCC